MKIVQLTWLEVFEWYKRGDVYLYFKTKEDGIKLVQGVMRDIPEYFIISPDEGDRVRKLLEGDRWERGNVHHLKVSVVRSLDLDKLQSIVALCSDIKFPDFLLAFRSYGADAGVLMGDFAEKLDCIQKTFDHVEKITLPDVLPRIDHNKLKVMASTSNDSSYRDFIEILLRDKHLVCDCGMAEFIVGKAPFSIRHEADDKFTVKMEGVKDSYDPENWIRIPELDFIDTELFVDSSAEIGFDLIDSIILMESSGFTVEFLHGKDQYYPSSGHLFMELLRERLKKK